jgi:hypothetical protein
MTTIEVIVNYIGQQSPDEVPDTLDWDEVVVTAIVLGLGPLLHEALAQVDTGISPLAKAKLAVTRKAQAARNKGIAQQLQQLLAAFAGQSVEALVLKGALLAPTVYPEAALRPMNDIDLLFHPDDLPRVERVLESLGYEGKHKAAGQGPGVTKHLSTYRRRGEEGATPNPYLSAEGDRMVEPHASLEESWFGLKINITPGIWQRALPVTLHDQPAYRLSNEDQLLHLAVHAVFHFIMGALVFLQLYDICRVVKVWGLSIDWEKLLLLSEQAGAQVFLYAGLYWSQQLYQAAIPETTLTTLAKQCPAYLLDYIHAFDAARILRQTQQPPLTTLPQRLRRGLQDRGEAARWAGSPMAKWKVWQTALAFHKTDTAAMLKKSFEVQA